MLIDSPGLVVTSVQIGRHESGWLTEHLEQRIFKRTNFLEHWDDIKISNS